MKYDLLPAEHIIADVFPASLDIDGVSQGEDFRIIITNATVCVFADFGDTPRLVDEVTYNFVFGSSREGYAVTTDDDGSWTIKRSNGCGCGTRLRGIHPFMGVPYKSQLERK